MIDLAEIQPHLTAEFVESFRKLGKQVGYRNLGRAIAYSKPTTSARTEDTPIIARNGNGHKGAHLPFCTRCGKELFGETSDNPDDPPYCRDCWAKKDAPKPVKIKLNQKDTLVRQCFTACPTHLPDLGIICSLPEKHDHRQHMIDGLLTSCKACKAATIATARVSVAAYVDARKPVGSHPSNKWWYEGPYTPTAYHWRNRLITWCMQSGMADGEAVRFAKRAHYQGERYLATERKLERAKAKKGR